MTQCSNFVGKPDELSKGLILITLTLSFTMAFETTNVVKPVLPKGPTSSGLFYHRAFKKSCHLIDAPPFTCIMNILCDVPGTHMSPKKSDAVSTTSPVGFTTFLWMRLQTGVMKLAVMLIPPLHTLRPVSWVKVSMEVDESVTARVMFWIFFSISVG